MPQHTQKQGKYIWCIHDDCINLTTPITSWKKLKQHMREQHNVCYNLKLVISKTIQKRNQKCKKKIKK